jgi:hypothetical protein
MCSFRRYWRRQTPTRRAGNHHGWRHVATTGLLEFNETIKPAGALTDSISVKFEPPDY